MGNKTHGDVVFTTDQLKRINELEDRARHLATIIDHIDDANQMGDTLSRLGFHKMQYECKGCDIYKDGKRAYSGAGISRVFTSWVRCDDMLHIVDEVDSVDGVITCRDTQPHFAWCKAVRLVAYQSRRILADAYTTSKR